MSDKLSADDVRRMAILAVQHPEEFVESACAVAKQCFEKGNSEAGTELANLRRQLDAANELRDALLAWHRECHAKPSGQRPGFAALENIAHKLAAQAAKEQT